MPYCYYTCNLLPLDLIVQSGYVPRWLGRYLASSPNSGPAEGLVVHPMTCPCVTKFVAAAENVLQDAQGAQDNCLIIPGGCDAMRRLGDLLAAAYPGRVFLLPLPRSSEPRAMRTLANDLRRLGDWLRSHLPEAGAEDAPAQLNSRVCAREDVQVHARGNAEVYFPESCPPVDYPSPPQPGGAFVIAGPLTDNSLLRLVEQCGVPVSAFESCTSPDRWRPLSGRHPLAQYEALAGFLLQTGMCPRRSTAERRAHLERRIMETHASSVIYARQSFCDPGAYDALLAADLASKLGLPFLEIEVDFPFDANGPLRTRVEAFLEAQLLDDELLDDALFDEASSLDNLPLEED